MARCRAAARRSASISAGPPNGAAFRPAWAASSTTPPTRMARSGVRWKINTPWLASSTAGIPGMTAPRMLATACAAVRQPEHGHGLDPALGAAVRHRVRGRVRRMRVQDAADVGVVLVHGRVHGHHGALDGREVTFEQGYVQPDP